MTKKMFRSLRLDFDFPDWELVKTIFKKREFVLSSLDLTVQDALVSKTSKGFHLYLTLSREVSKETVIFLQLALGSDYKREVFNWRRFVMLNVPLTYNVLFYEKYVREDSGLKLVSQEVNLDKETEELKAIINEWKTKD